jgi:ABC-type transport system substrate-binding protein
MFGTCTPAYIHVDKNSLGYNPAYATRYPYDPDKAKSMFQQLGMLGKSPIKFMQLQGVLPGWGRLAEMVAGDMQAIGLNVQLDPQDFSVFGENVWGSNKGNYQMLTSFMGRGNRYPTFLSQGNIQLNAVANPAFPGSKPPAKYNEGFLKLSVALTEKAQRKWALQMTESIMDESWDIAVAYQRTQYAMAKNLHGFAVSRDEHPILERMSFS